MQSPARRVRCIAMWRSDNTGCRWESLLTEPHQAVSVFAADSSWQASKPQNGKGDRFCLRRKRFLVAEIGHVEMTAGMLEAEIIDAEHAHPQADFGADRIELRIEGFFRNGKLGEPHRDHAALAPDKQGERLFKGDDFEGPGIGHAVVG